MVRAAWSSMGETRDSFLTFALEVHAVDGVADAAVLLQDDCAVDVDVLLFAAFVGAARGQAFGREQLTVALERVEPWQREVIEPLRAVRRRLKDGPPPAPDSETSALRERIKQIELDAEMIELAELADVAVRLDGHTADGDAAERATAAMALVVQTSAGREPTTAERAAIDVIARAAAGRRTELLR
jgi:uncharacterized protein (TIGR02444 family)